MAYATVEDLVEYMGTVDSSLDNPDRVLERASDLIDTATLGRIDTDNTEHAEAATKAVCAQVEFWLEGGEQVDIGGPIQGYSIGSLQIQYGAGSNRVTPGRLAPRAKDALFLAGLLYRGVGVSR